MRVHIEVAQDLESVISCATTKSLFFYENKLGVM
jgi:hypothetical protein